MQTTPSRLPILIAYLATLAILLICSELTEYRLWAFSYLGYYAMSTRIIFLSVMALVGIGIYAAIPSLLPRLEGMTTRGYVVTTVVIGVVLMVCFYVFRASTHFLGDGYTLISILTDPVPVIKPRNWGGTLLPYLLRVASGERTEAAAEWAYQLGSIIGGAVFLSVGAVLLYKAYQSTVKRLLMFLGLISGGYLLLFFGYVENYPMFLVTILLFSLTGIRVMRSEVSPWWLVLLALVGMSFHIFGSSLFLPAAYAVVIRSKYRTKIESIWRRHGLGISVVGIIVIVVGISVAAYISLYVRYSLVQPFDSPFAMDHYTLFSSMHLLDMLCLLFVLSPSVGLLITALWRRQSRPPFDPILIFLLLQVMTSWGIAFIFEGKLGMARDWDLFAFAGIPTILWACHWILTQRITIRTATVLLLSAALSTSVILPRAGIAMDPDRAIATMLDYLHLDPAKNRSMTFALYKYYQQAGDTTKATHYSELRDSLFPYEDWSRTASAYIIQGKSEQGRILALKAMQANPSYASGWLAMGMYHLNLKNYDSAKHYIIMADGLNPNMWATISELGRLAYVQGDFKTAEHYFQEASEIGWEYDTPPYNLAHLRLQQGDYRGYFSHMEDAVSRKHVDVGTMKELGDAYAKTGDSARAALYYHKAESLNVSLQSKPGLK